MENHHLTQNHRCRSRTRVFISVETMLSGSGLVGSVHHNEDDDNNEDDGMVTQ